MRTAMRYYVEIVGGLLVYAVIVAGVVLMLAMGTSCAQVDAIGNAGKALVVDCGKAEIVKASNEIGPLVETLLIESVDGEGRVNFDPVKEAAGRWTAELGGCLLSSTIERLLRPSTNDPNAPKLSGVEIDREALRQGFEQLKSAKWGGVTFALPNGRKL